MAFVARNYQTKAHQMMIEGFKQSLNLLVLMPTGTGKTKTMISFMEKYSKFYNFVVIVRQRELVRQFASAVEEFGIDYGVHMASDKRYSPEKGIQICSVDTLDSREEYPLITNPRDLVVFIDEADETNSEKYLIAIEKYTKRSVINRPENFLSEPIKMRNAFLAGFTATAYDSPLPHFDKAIIPITAKEALEIGALVDFDYVVPQFIDLENVRIEKGEFNPKDVESKLNTPELIADSFKHWQEFGDNRQTLVFTTSKDHANNVANYINGYYGQVIAGVIDANTKNREEIYSNFRNGKLRFLVNIRIVTRGVDIPEIGTILDCAATLKANMHIQKLGRGSRPNPFYKNCIYIDMANNCINNGDFYEFPRVVNLKEKIKRKRVLGEAMRVCLKCRRASLTTVSNFCPYCKNPFVKNEQKLTKEQLKKLSMQNASPEQIKQLKMINEYKKSLWQYENLGKKYPYNIAKEYAHNKLIEKYGLESVLKIKNTIGYKA